MEGDLLGGGANDCGGNFKSYNFKIIFNSKPGTTCEVWKATSSVAVPSTLASGRMASIPSTKHTCRPVDPSQSESLSESMSEPVSDLVSDSEPVTVPVGDRVGVTD